MSRDNQRRELLSDKIVALLHPKVHQIVTFFTILSSICHVFVTEWVLSGSNDQAYRCRFFANNQSRKSAGARRKSGITQRAVRPTM